MNKIDRFLKGYKVVRENGDEEKGNK